MTDDSIHPELRATAADRAEVVLRAVTSAVDVAMPGLGSVFGELINTIIPNTRQERFAVYLTRLGRRLAQTNQRLDDLASRLGPEQRAIFEEAAQSATRATSSQRIDRLARLAARGMTSDEEEAERGRTIIQILDQLSEGDLLALDGFVGRMGPDPRGQRTSYVQMPNLTGLTHTEQHSRLEIFRQEQEEASALQEHRLSKLLSLNLLAQEMQLLPNDRRTFGGLPPVPTVHRDQPRLTPLGRMILERVGLGQKTWVEVVEHERFNEDTDQA